jgi:hypothetical protein
MREEILAVWFTSFSSNASLLRCASSNYVRETSLGDGLSLSAKQFFPAEAFLLHEQRTYYRCVSEFYFKLFN